jgi:WD40 repeat protein
MSLVGHVQGADWIGGNERYHILKQIVIDTLAEDLKAIAVGEQKIVFGGELGVGYLYDVSKDKLITMHGHFAEITQIETNKGGYILTASRDFSVRLWDSTYGIQLYLFLDINC